MKQILLGIALLSLTASAQTADAVTALNTYLDRIANEQLDQRAKTVAAIGTREQAEQRQHEVRRKILELIAGPMPATGPVPVKEFGTLSGDGFRVEKIAYQSAPGFYVTAHVFVPAARTPSAGAGRFPAILLAPGHGPGKESQYNWAANFARAGIIALAVDPLGQGERLQHYDPELETSKLPGSTAEHEHASLSTLLIGAHVSRYFLNDGIRAVDYLTQRPDVDARHIGAFGCSGGGTATAYLAALDARISAAATACYLTSFKELLATRGPQEAEQSIPDFIASGFDFPDWVELAAPRPYAIVSTTEDMFPFAGARSTFEESKRFYQLLGAEDKLQWITGPGGHGNLGPISQQIFAFFVKNLKGSDNAPQFGQFRPASPDDLLNTPTGQVATSLGGETVESMNRKARPTATDLHEAAMTAPRSIPASARAIARITATPGAAPAVTVVKTEQRDGYRLETLTIASEPGIDLTAQQAIPDRAGPHPTILLMDGAAELPRLAQSGKIVVALTPRGTPPPATGAAAASLAPGPYQLPNLRAILVGKTLIGMRADDTIRIVNWLASRADVDKSSITVYGRGALGIVALHAAALDSRITRVVTENTLLSYRMALDAPVHRNLAEVTIPGVLKRYDLIDLVRAIAPREVTVVNAATAVGQPARDETVRQQLGANVRILHRGPREPLPID